jgi:prolyl oligopeptidase
MRSLAFLIAGMAATSASADPYRSLEDPARAAAYARRADAEGRRALARLGDAGALRARILAAASAERRYVPFVAGGRRFYLRGDGQAARLALVVDEAGASRVLVEATDGLATSLWPSPDGARIAIAVARVGEPGLRVRVVDVASGRARDAGGAPVRRGRPLVAWSPLGDVLYTVPAGVPRLVAHRGGEAATVLEADGDEIVGLAARDGRDDLVLIVRRGQRQRADAVAGTAVTTLVPEGDGELRYAGEHAGRAVFATTRGAPRGRVVRAGDGGVLEEVVAEDAAVIETWPGAGRMAIVAGGAVYVVLRDRGLARLRRHPLDGTPATDVELPSAGVIWSGLVPGGGRLAFSLTGFVDPGSVHELDPGSGALSTWARPRLPYDPAEVVTESLTYPSGMGPAPMLIVRHRDTPRDGRRPTLIYGYAFGGWISGPWFRPHLHAWLSAGGLFAVPALRGGGELGEEWRRAGAGIHRQNAIDDLLAAAAELARLGWTRPELVVAEGQSVGGGVAASAAARRPRAFAGVILAHPVLDLLRFHTHPAGRRWIPELGDPDDPAQRPALRRASPLHAVRRGACHPATLILPSERDATAASWHGLKLHAALRAAQGCDRPILLRMAWGADHTYGRDAAEVAASYADQLVFAWSATGEGRATASPRREGRDRGRPSTRSPRGP